LILIKLLIIVNLNIYNELSNCLPLPVTPTPVHKKNRNHRFPWHKKKWKLCVHGFEHATPTPVQKQSRNLMYTVKLERGLNKMMMSFVCSCRNKYIYIYRSLCGLRREEEEVTQGTPI